MIAYPQREVVKHRNSETEFPQFQCDIHLHNGDIYIN